MKLVKFLPVVIIGVAAATFAMCAPAQTEDPWFTIVVLPDTQYYASRYEATFVAQTRWIAEQTDSRRIDLVVHVGDIVDSNTAAQWEVARASFAALDGVVPYVLSVGNHDMGVDGHGGAKDRSTLLNDYFAAPPSAFLYEAGRLDNSYQLLEAGGASWLVLSLEFGPRDGVLDWGNRVVASHPDHRVIIVTHCYLYADGTRVGPDDDSNPAQYGVAQDPGETVNDGEQIWDKLVRRHANIVLVLSGHILHGGTARSVSIGDHGNRVHEILSNYQGHPRGGDGWLRLLRVEPGRGRIVVETYSPTRREWWRDAANQFTIDL